MVGLNVGSCCKYFQTAAEGHILPINSGYYRIILSSVSDILYERDMLGKRLGPECEGVVASDHLGVP